MTKVLNKIRLRILITSRPEIPIRCGFSQISEAERQVFILHDVPPRLVDRDLTLFFKENFATIREERGFPDDWPGMRVIMRLVETSCGLFLWASTACRYIREGRQLAMRRIFVLINGHRSDAGPEKQLDEIYITVLKDCVPQEYSKEEREELYQRLKEVLGSIAILFSPLSADSLANLLQSHERHVNETLADFHTILNIPSQRTGRSNYTILHFVTFWSTRTAVVM